MSDHKKDGLIQKSRTIIPSEDATHRSGSLFLFCSRLGAVINPCGPVLRGATIIPVNLNSDKDHRHLGIYKEFFLALLAAGL